MRSRDCAGLSFPASSPRPTETLRAPAEPRSRRRDRHDDTEDPLTPDDYLARVRALLPAVGERAVRAEQLRRLPDETFKDFQAAGLFRCIQPKRYEGFELDPGTFYRAVMEVAAVCGSSEIGRASCREGRLIVNVAVLFCPKSSERVA